MNICAAALPSPELEVLERKSQADAPVAREGSKIVWPKPDCLNIELFSRMTMAARKFIFRPSRLSILFFALLAGPGKRFVETGSKRRRQGFKREASTS